MEKLTALLQSCVVLLISPEHQQRQEFPLWLVRQKNRGGLRLVDLSGTPSGTFL